MVIVAGRAYVDPARRGQLLAGLEDSIRQARAEAGCLDYAVAADPLEADRVNVFELWESREHLARHLANGGAGPELASPVLRVDVSQYEVGRVLPMGR
jgi:quinol monooxygenase YgiN